MRAAERELIDRPRRRYSHAGRSRWKRNPNRAGRLTELLFSSKLPEAVRRYLYPGQRALLLSLNASTRGQIDLSALPI